MGEVEMFIKMNDYVKKETKDKIRAQTEAVVIRSICDQIGHLTFD
jgi:hypothetical protein